VKQIMQGKLALYYYAETTSSRDQIIRTSAACAAGFADAMLHLAKAEGVAL